ncbi:beta/gamma crystallin-related protein [Rhodoferax sp. PAMC 29310]|uniref:beta/gamma crystallin-related protein n=1 Tax=Rhodoferax sp. PAMC 29310 TaxID=2822760 RepID=UPI001B32686E|nr:beta/gamma crystallin-related protein [Rhodoferax sp. PAMC 29310]
MNARLKLALAAAAVALASHAAAEVVFYEHDEFQGRSFTTKKSLDNLRRQGFNDRASSVDVRGERWEVCEDRRFSGRCVVLRPGRYSSLTAMGLNDRISSVRSVPKNARIGERNYAPAPIVAKITFYENPGFAGRSFTTDQPVFNFKEYGFNDRASSAEVIGQSWEVCEDTRFSGRCAVLRPGRYPSFSAKGLNNRASSVRNIEAPAPVAAKITFYENPGFAGRSFTTEQPVLNFKEYGFNDRASSAEITGQSWEVCEDTRFSGQCAVLRPGRYPSFAAMGLNNRASSVRNIDANAPMPAADYRRRDNERLYEAPVTSVRAVLVTPEQRCWVEREQVAQNQSSTNVPAAIAGALIGGILGHQVGGGTGKDLATIGGAVAGAAVGAQVGRNGNTSPAASQDVQRCETTPNKAEPRFWDVGYTFRGQEYHVQMTTQPGSTVTVNAQGEPRN